MVFYRFMALLFSAAFLAISPLLAADYRRIHTFPRSLAMGGAYTAVADGVDTVAYNPAGLLIQKTDWSIHVPIIWMGYNELVANSMAGKSSFDTSNKETVNSLPGTRAALEVHFGPYFWAPNAGVYLGLLTDLWVEIVFPKQTIVPLVHIEVVADGALEYGQAFELGDSGLFVGANLRAVQKAGINMDISMLRFMADDTSTLVDDLVKEQQKNQPPIRYVGDIGFLYRFEHPLQPRIGVSAINVGGVDYKAVGKEKQLNSIGIAMTQSIKDLHLTYSADYRDFTYSYFNSNSYRARTALGFEAAFARNPDNSSLIALQLGIRDLRYLSYGITGRIGPMAVSSVVWIENFGTDKNPLPDERYLFVFALEF